MEEYLKAAYSLYTDLIKLHKKYALTDTENAAGDIIADINAINDKYQVNYCNALTDALRRWHLELFSGATMAEQIKTFYTDLWKLHKKYAAGKLEHNAADFIKESQTLSEKYSDPYKRNRPVETILMALADEIEKPTLRG